MKNHLLPNVICSAAVQGKARTVNLLDSYLLLELTEDNELLVGGEEGTKVLARDIVATNGVMHVVDSPILPLEGECVSGCCFELGKSRITLSRDSNTSELTKTGEFADIISQLVLNIRIYNSKNYKINPSSPFHSPARVGSAGKPQLDAVPLTVGDCRYAGRAGRPD